MNSRSNEQNTNHAGGQVSTWEKECKTDVVVGATVTSPITDVVVGATVTSPIRPPP